MIKKHDSKFKAVGTNIKKYRVQRKITQKELAKRLGISLSYLTKIEAPNCSKTFSLEVLFDISDELKVDIKNFFD